jgi:hypothetical protein
VDWKVAGRFTLIAGIIVVGVVLSIFVFDKLWLHFGFWAGALAVAVALYFVNRWSKQQAERERKRLKL